MHGQQEVRVEAAGDIVFKNGETKRVSDARAAVLLRNPQFVDASTGKNPNFRCVVCDTVVLSKGFISPRLEIVPYRDEHGRRLCGSRLC